MDEKARCHMIFKDPLREEFGLKQDPQKAIKDALLLKLLGKQSAYDFSLKAKKSYEKAGFKMEQKFFFLSNAVLFKE